MYELNVINNKRIFVIKKYSGRLSYRVHLIYKDLRYVKGKEKLRAKEYQKPITEYMTKGKYINLKN